MRTYLVDEALKAGKYANSKRVKRKDDIVDEDWNLRARMRVDI